MLGKIATGLIFLLLVWGNLVAGMKAGLACPDWPLCHGKVLPPFRIDIYMEFLHRVIAALAGGALAALSARRHRAYRGAARAVPAAALLLLLAEIGMGGAVVLLGTPARLTTLHFVTGVLIFLLASYMASFDGEKEPPKFSARGSAALFLSLGALVFVQGGLGAYVRHADAGLACPDFPTCLGRVVPPILSGGVLLQLSHRILGAVIFVTALLLYAACAADPGLRRNRGLALSLCVLVFLQIGLGGLVVLSRLAYAATALHLAVALMMLSVLLHLWVREVRGAEGRLSLP